MIFFVYLFDRNGTCIFFREWHRTNGKNLRQTPPQDEIRIMYGMVYSMKQFAKKASPGPNPQANQFLAYRTAGYKLHLFESANLFKILLATDSHVGDCQGVLAQLYRDVYSAFLLRSPFLDPRLPITSEAFASRLDGFVQALPFFK